MSTLADERHYTVQQIAELWGISPQSVRRLFDDEPGVLKLSLPRLVKHTRAPKVSLRVPASVLERVHEQWSGGFRLEVQRRRRRSGTIRE
jgi:predicted transcriptional regulator